MAFVKRQLVYGEAFIVSHTIWDGGEGGGEGEYNMTGRASHASVENSDSKFWRVCTCPKYIFPYFSLIFLCLL